MKQIKCNFQLDILSFYHSKAPDIFIFGGNWMEQGTVIELGGFYCSPFGPPEAQLLPFLKNSASLGNIFVSTGYFGGGT